MSDVSFGNSATFTKLNVKVSSNVCWGLMDWALRKRCLFLLPTILFDKTLLPLELGKRISNFK